MNPHQRSLGIPIVGGAAALVAIGVLAVASLSHAATPTNEARQLRLTSANAIRADVHAQMQLLPGVQLRLTPPTSTDSIDSFMLLSEDLLGQRFVPAAAGVWYSICARRGPCVSPAPRLTRPAADHVPRRLALELAVRTFLETDAPVVAVSLPTPRIVVVIFARDELEREVGLGTLASRLGRERPHIAPSDELRNLVDTLTLPRTYLHLGPEGAAWGGMPRWPRRPW
jgi:hypothetical protein